MHRAAWTLTTLLGVASICGCAHSDNIATQLPTAPVAAAQVEWATWSKASFTAASEQRRLVLVNVVAVWCHWCHVMEETTYADPEVAALLREHFVTIRVDSDARPDVAERYREWGWPATAILDPDANAVLELRGYQPPAAFAALLRELVADARAGKLARRKQPPVAAPARDRALATIAAHAVARLDHFYEPRLGGWGTKQRYPLAAPIEHAFFRARVHGQSAWSARALTTLAAEIKLIDPVWGGMYQYSVGGDWDHPHYEKIVAIQAGALANYALALRATGDERWRTAAAAIAGYMTEEMRSPNGAFFTSQDADLRRDGKPPITGEDYYRLGSAERRALGIPRIDRNVYADLNGAMIEAFCELYAATGDATALTRAEAAAREILRTHLEPGGAFTHAAGPAPMIYLRDQAAMGRALLALYRSTGDVAWRDAAERTADVIVGRLQDTERGGFFAHSEDPEAVGVFADRRRPLEENGLAARFLLAMHRYRDGDGSKSTPWDAPARRALAVLGDDATLDAEGRMIGTYVMAVEEASMTTVDVTVVGRIDDGGATRQLLQAALRVAEPRAVVELSAPGERYPDIGKPAAYLCTQTACSSPITSPERMGPLAEEFVRSSLPNGTPGDRLQ